MNGKTTTTKIIRNSADTTRKTAVFFPLRTPTLRLEYFNHSGSLFALGSSLFMRPLRRTFLRPRIPSARTTLHPFPQYTPLFPETALPRRFFATPSHPLKMSAPVNSQVTQVTAKLAALNSSVESLCKELGREQVPVHCA